MKKISLLFWILFFLSCSQTPPVKTDLYLYFDYTEGQDYSGRITEDAESYIELLGISEMGSPNYGTVRMYPLYDVSSARSKSVKLKPGKGEMEGNKYIRDKEVGKFKTKLLESLESLNSENMGKSLDNSHIYMPICKGIKKLNKSDAGRKVMVIYSDMLENSDLANFHSKKRDFDKWKVNFDEACDCEDTADLEIYVVYPVDKNNDSKIQTASEFWSDFLMGKGLDEDAFHFETTIDL